MNAHDPDLAQSPTAQSLRSFVDRLVHLEEERKQLAADIKEVKSEARSQGFDVKVIAQMVRESMMDEEQRAAQREHEEICEVYRANLGMLRGTPLGDAARKRAAAKPPKKEPDEPDEPDDDGPPDEPGQEAPDASAPPTDGEPAMPPEDVEAARERGRTAGLTGEKIFANPYVNGDPRRAAWDEGWCQGSGSDGMEVPEAWRRRPKPKPEGDGAAP